MRCCFTLMLLLALASFARAQDRELDGGVVLRGFDPASRPPSLSLRDPLQETGMRTESTAADRTSLELNLQDDGIVLVRERRRIPLLPGQHRLRFVDVPTSLLPDSVQVRAVDAPAAVQVLEQRFVTPVNSARDLFHRRIGQPAMLVQRPENGPPMEARVEIVGYDNGPVLRMGDRILVKPEGTVLLPEGPDTPARPTLHWLIENDGVDQELEVAYTAYGFAWHTALQLNLESGNRGWLSAWLRVHNDTDADFEEAALLLSLMAMNPAGQVRLPRLVALARHQEHQIQLLAPVEVEVTQEAQELRLRPLVGAELPGWIAGIEMNRAYLSPEVKVWGERETPRGYVLERAGDAWRLVGL